MNAKMSLIDAKMKDDVHAIIERLDEFGAIKTDELVKVRKYQKDLEGKAGTKKFILRDHKNPDMIEDLFKEIESELDWINGVKLYRSSVVSILILNGQCNRPFRLANTGYSNNPFFDFKRLVEMINAFYLIAEPYKAPNKIAYGWSFCMDKSNPRAYLCACIKNYLARNEVEFDIRDIQKICGLRDCESGDE